jgi:hypothetical protein
MTRADPALDGPVILFQDVIEILHGAVLAIVGQIACGLEPGGGAEFVLAPGAGHHHPQG